MRTPLTAITLILCCVAPSWCAESDDTILLQLAKADLVIAGKLESVLMGVAEAGVVNYVCQLRNVERLAGPVLAASTPPSTPSQPGTITDLPTQVTMVRYDLDKGEPPAFLKAGARLILFLKRLPAGNVPGWATSDMWFGAQPYSDMLARSIGRLASHDPHRGDPLAEIAFWRVMRPIPEQGVRPWTPVPTAGLRLQVYSELSRNPALRALFSKLHVRAAKADWQPVVAEFEQRRSFGCLQLLLCHPNQDLQQAALAALGRVKDPDAVPFLLIYADYLATAAAGDGHLSDAVSTELCHTVAAITGVTHEPRPGEPDPLRKAIAKWQLWQAEQVLADQTHRHQGDSAATRPGTCEQSRRPWNEQGPFRRETEPDNTAHEKRRLAPAFLVPLQSG